jgi:hypothetical protein
MTEGRLTAPDETTDDFTERRIAQAERVMALYKTWWELVNPPDQLQPPDDGPGDTFEQFLANATADIIKALALPWDLVGDGTPANSMGNPGPTKIWAKGVCDGGRISMYWCWWPEGGRGHSACGSALGGFTTTDPAPVPYVPADNVCTACLYRYRHPGRHGR